MQTTTEPKPELKDLLDDVIAQHIEIYRAGFATGFLAGKREARKEETHEKYTAQAQMHQS